MRSFPGQLSRLHQPSQIYFAVARFTTGRFSEEETRLQALLRNLRVDAQAVIPLQTLQIAALSALNKVDSIPSKLEGLRETINKQPKDFELGWGFEGSKHFISQDARLAFHRAWLLDLLTGMGGKTRGEMVAAVEAARAKFTEPTKR